MMIVTAVVLIIAVLGHVDFAKVLARDQLAKQVLTQIVIILLADFQLALECDRLGIQRIEYRTVPALAPACAISLPGSSSISPSIISFISISRAPQ